MKKIVVLLLALCLLLCGCASWMDGSYISITPHQEENTSTDQEMISISSYLELRDALVDLVENGTESATISIEAFNLEKLDSNMAMAVRYVTSSNPIGAYAVESISYEQGTSGGVPAVAISITYLHNREEIRRIQRVNGMEEAEYAVAEALDACDIGIVFLVDGYSKTDFAQMIEDYADLHPESVMEIPTVTVNIYPENGLARVVELKFNYQTNRESLRTMQGKVQDVFASAGLYVRGTASDDEKYTQLFSFLTNRFSYQLETSITPSYSLLCYGVGDTKANAVCFAAMCRQAGLECLVVSGTRAGEPWFWNIICDEGIYYHVDLIQSSQSGNLRKMTDDEMDGYVWDYSAYPECVMPENDMELDGEPVTDSTEPYETEPETLPTVDQTAEPETQPPVEQTTEPETLPVVEPTTEPTVQPPESEPPVDPTATEGFDIFGKWY